MDNIKDVEKLWKFKKLPNPHAKDNYKLMLTEYLGDDSVVVIPENINGHEVTHIGRNLFYRNENITSVIIPESITNIGVFRKNVEIPAFAFFYCDDLINIYVSKNNKKFASEDGILYDKSKNTLLMVPQHKQGTFTIPDFVKKIGICAFCGCWDLKYIEIPDNISEIEKGAFLDCGNLTGFKVSRNNTSYVSEDGVLYNKSKNILLRVPMQRQGIFNIIDGITEIAHEAFQGCKNITDVVIPQSVIKIGKEAFSECINLKSINVNENNKIYSSEDGVLYNKTKTDLLRYPHEKKGAFTFPNGVTKIGFNAFSGCATLMKIELPDGVIEIENEAFFDCIGLKIIKIPTTVIKIGEWSFFGCDNLKIFCKLGSYAEQYARKNNILYESY